MSVGERDAAIEAGLLLGECEWCSGDVWVDRGPYWKSREGGYLWHGGCYERAAVVVDDAELLALGGDEVTTERNENDA